MIILIQSSKLLKLVYLFSCAGFACPQLDVPCYQFIATCNKKTESKVTNKNKDTRINDRRRNITDNNLNWTEGGTLVIPWMHVLCQKKSSVTFPRAPHTQGKHTSHRSQATITPLFPIGNRILSFHFLFKISQALKGWFSYFTHKFSLACFTPPYWLLTWACSLITDCSENRTMFFMT